MKPSFNLAIREAPKNPGIFPFHRVLAQAVKKRGHCVTKTEERSVLCLASSLHHWQGIERKYTSVQHLCTSDVTDVRNATSCVLAPLPKRERKKKRTHFKNLDLN